MPQKKKIECSIIDLLQSCQIGVNHNKNEMIDNKNFKICYFSAASNTLNRTGTSTTQFIKVNKC